MNNKDEIKELFNERFSNFESSVDPRVWKNVQQGLGATSTPTASNSIFGTTSIVVLASVVAVIATIGYTYVNSNSESSPISRSETTEIPVIENLEETNSSTEPTPVVIVDNSVAKPEVSENTTITKETTNSSTESETIYTGQTPEPVNKELQNEAQLNQSAVAEKTETENSETINTEANVISKAPKSIDIKEQSRVVASPMGGKAPLKVSFNSLAEVKEIKWTFDDGTESTEVQPNHTYTIPGIYFVTMLAELSGGTIVMDKAVIEVKEDVTGESKLEVSPEISVPNVITPNGDGKNDGLTIDCSGVSSFSMSIYSVNGKLVYQSENPDEKWDGNDLYGNQLSDGVYYYLINVIGVDENVYVPKGYITLKR